MLWLPAYHRTFSRRGNSTKARNRERLKYIRILCCTGRLKFLFGFSIAVLLALIQIKIALLSKHEWMAPLASDMLGKYAGPPKPCRSQFLSTIDATSPFVGHRVVRRTCQYRTKEDDILVGVWHSRRTEPRMRWILDSWGFGGKNIVFLGQSESSSECLPITSTGSPKDDFESTLHKGLVGLARMYDEYPEKKWYIIVGDDTYVNIRNTANILSAFDPARPWVMSEVTNITRHWYKGLRMNGGAGIVTSRSFVTKIRKFIPRIVRQLASEAISGKKRLLNMHDLIFGNITWSMGFNVTHADGFYSQTPMYYASIGGPGQLFHRKTHLTRGFVGRPGILHYITGPFMPWVHFILNAAQEPCQFDSQSLSSSSLSSSLSTAFENVADDVVIAVFRTSKHGYQWTGHKKGIHDTFGKYYQITYIRPSIECITSVLKDILDISAGEVSSPLLPPQWIFLITDAVFVVPKSLRALIDDLNSRIKEQSRRVDVVGRLHHGYRSSFIVDSGIIVHRSVLETILARESLLPCIPHAWRVAGGTSMLLHRRHPENYRIIDVLGRKIERVLHMHRAMHYAGLLPQLQDSRTGNEDAGDQKQCAVTVPLLSPKTAGSDLYSRQLAYMCGSHKERKRMFLSWIDVPLCQAAIAFDKQADKIEAEEIKMEREKRVRQCMKRRTRQGGRARPGSQQCVRLGGSLSKSQQREERLGQKAPCNSDAQMKMAHVLTWYSAV